MNLKMQQRDLTTRIIGVTEETIPTSLDLIPDQPDENHICTQLLEPKSQGLTSSRPKRECSTITLLIENVANLSPNDI